MTGTLQVHGDPAVHLLHLKVARAMWHHLHQGEMSSRLLIATGRVVRLLTD
jgi:hypothetical protein